MRPGEPDLSEQAGEGRELSGPGNHRQARDGAGGRAGGAAEGSSRAGRSISPAHPRLIKLSLGEPAGTGLGVA